MSDNRNERAPPRGRMPTIEWLPIGELRVDHSYQRSIDNRGSQRLIARIAAEWDWDLFDVLKVSRRPDDGSFVVDGQHRREAALLRGDIPQLPCVIKRCAGPEDEARLFIAANRERKRMGRIDDFRAAVGAGDEQAMTVKRLVEDAGLTIARSESLRRLGPGEIGSVVGLGRLIRMRGERPVQAALTLMAEAFPDEVLHSSSTMLAALVDLMTIHTPRIEYQPLFDALLSYDTEGWSATAGLAHLRSGSLRVRTLRARIAAVAVQQGAMAA